MPHSINNHCSANITSLINSHACDYAALIVPTNAFFAVVFALAFLLLSPLAVYRTARATQGEMHRNVHFSFDRTGNSA